MVSGRPHRDEPDRFRPEPVLGCRHGHRRYPAIVLDCPDPGVLARFYGELLGWEAKVDDDWGQIQADYGQTLCFQQVADFAAPRWPGQDAPQQMHLDLMVDDLDEAEQVVLGLGGTKAEHQPGTTFRVFLDPAGHPFCACVS